MSTFHYVYTLESVAGPGELYTGQAADLRRLGEHDAGNVPHTSKWRPWVVRSAIAFREFDRALAFERYLKSGSGRAFLSPSTPVRESIPGSAGPATAPADEGLPRAYFRQPSRALSYKGWEMVER